MHLYILEEPSEFTLYTDVGDGYEASRLDQFSLKPIAGGLDLTWESDGEFRFPYESIRVQVHGMNVQQAWADGVAISLQNNQVKVALLNERMICFP